MCGSLQIELKITVVSTSYQLSLHCLCLYREDMSQAWREYTQQVNGRAFPVHSQIKNLIMSPKITITLLRWALQSLEWVTPLVLRPLIWVRKNLSYWEKPFNRGKRTPPPLNQLRLHIKRHFSWNLVLHMLSGWLPAVGAVRLQSTACDEIVHSLNYYWLYTNHLKQYLHFVAELLAPVFDTAKPALF